jgi:UPF0042 nucleotide-binding protein
MEGGHAQALALGEVVMKVEIVSFGFRWEHAHSLSVLRCGPWLVVDARHVDDPDKTFAGSPLRGTDKEVQDVVLANPAAKAIVDTLERTIRWTQQPGIVFSAGSAGIRVAIGCHSGRHRSVAIAEKLAQRLNRRGGFEVEVVHRDADK